jgi:hypothetical protein
MRTRRALVVSDRALAAIVQIAHWAHKPVLPAPHLQQLTVVRLQASCTAHVPERGAARAQLRIEQPHHAQADVVVELLEVGYAFLALLVFVGETYLLCESTTGASGEPFLDQHAGGCPGQDSERILAYDLTALATEDFTFDHL